MSTVLTKGGFAVEKGGSGVRRLVLGGPFLGGSRSQNSVGKQHLLPAWGDDYLEGG